jgi:hypothetical protein
LSSKECALSRETVGCNQPSKLALTMWYFALFCVLDEVPSTENDNKATTMKIDHITKVGNRVDAVILWPVLMMRLVF